VVFALFYGLFVVAVAIHAPIGLRNVLREWTPWRGRSLDGALALLSLLLLLLGLRAVIAVYS
jgi:fumarate reductase subunit C